MALRAVVLLTLLALVAAACGGGSESQSQQSSGPVKVKYLLPFSRSIAFWPVHLAEELGYFRDEGLDINSEATDGSSFVIQQVAAGNAEFGIAVAGPVLLGYERNQNFTSVYDFLTGNGFNLWVPSDSPVQRIEDIQKGANIAIKDLEGGEIPGLNVQLQRAGLQPDVDVHYQQFGDNASLAADMLAKNKAAAMEISWNSLVGVQLALGKMGKQLRCITCAATDQEATESVVVSKDFLKDHRNLVEGMGRALAKATLFGQTNPKAALAIMKRVNPEEQTDAEYARTYFDAALQIMKPRAPQSQFGWQDPATWQRSMDLLLAPGIPSGLSDKVDIGALVSNDLVGAYNNFDHDAVTKQARDFKA
jgi:NitT/TauT family transport system substrate-binding protein